MVKLQMSLLMSPHSVKSICKEELSRGSANGSCNRSTQRAVKEELSAGSLLLSNRSVKQRS